MASSTASTQRPGAGPTTEDLSTAASVLTSFSNAAPNVNAPVAYTPTTNRISKAKKGKKVHVCEYGCGKVSFLQHLFFRFDHCFVPEFSCNRAVDRIFVRAFNNKSLFAGLLSRRAQKVRSFVLYSIGRGASISRVMSPAANHRRRRSLSVR